MLTQGKHSVSALELKRQLGVHYETAWSMKQKILEVMVEREEDRRLTGRVEVDDAYDGGERHEGKRGRGAEGKTPFVVAVQTDVENPDQVLFLKMKTLKAVSTKELKPWFEEYIEPGTLILTDGWKAYHFLEEDFEHDAQKSPGGWKSAKVPAFRWVNTVLGNLKGEGIGRMRPITLGEPGPFRPLPCRVLLQVQPALRLEVHPTPSPRGSGQHPGHATAVAKGGLDGRGNLRHRLKVKPLGTCKIQLKRGDAEISRRIAEEKIRTGYE